MKKINLAVAGASSAIGQEILKTLAERSFPAAHVAALETGSAGGREVSYGEDDVLHIENLDTYDFSKTQLCLLAVGEFLAKSLAPRIAASGCMAIDLSAQFRMDPDVPLIVPEVNPDALAGGSKKRIVATPSCVVVQLLMALKPLHDLASIKRVVISSYQSVSDAGREAMDELFNQTRSIYVNDQINPEVFRKQIAFNVIPHIGTFKDDGSTTEEWNMIVETKKVLGSKIKVAATCVRVPVFIGHALAVNVEFEAPLSASDARVALKKMPGITVIDHKHEEGFVTPAECTGEDAVFVSRIREDISVENGLNMWIVSDSLRKGSALNAVQIAEVLAKENL